MMDLRRRSIYKFHPLYIVVPLLLFLVFVPLYLCPQQLHEEVTVTAFEVPIRVLYKGNPVKNLSIDDFTILEKGIPQKITGLDVISRKIDVPFSYPDSVIPDKRVFVLIFNVFDYFEEVGRAIDDFFANYYRQGDQYIILTENKLFDMGNGENTAEIALRLKSILKKFKQVSSQNTFMTYRELSRRSNELNEHLQGVRIRGATGGISSNPYYETVRFLEFYLHVWNQYKKQYLLPDLGFYQNLIKRIKIMEGEKWVICFQQRDLFPSLRIEGRLNTEISRLLGDQGSQLQIAWQRQIEILEREINKSQNFTQYFPMEEMKKIFMEVGSTVHTIILRSTMPLVSNDFTLIEVEQEFENCMRDLSFITGGFATFSNKVASALKKAAEKEDYFYVLWYSPKDLDIKKRDISVKVNVDRARVIYRSNLTQNKKFPLAIDHFKVEGKTLDFIIRNYEQIAINEENTGFVEVKITVYDNNSKIIFDSKRMLELYRKEANFNITLNSIQNGSYFVIIEVIDKIANEKNVLSRVIDMGTSSKGTPYPSRSL